MSKAIVRIDIPDDYADEYKEWVIDGRLYYLEDGAWTFLKEVECKVELYRNAIPIEWIKKYAKKGGKIANILFPFEIEMMIEEWEKENEQEKKTN